MIREREHRFPLQRCRQISRCAIQIALRLLRDRVHREISCFCLLLRRRIIRFRLRLYRKIGIDIFSLFCYALFVKFNLCQQLQRL